MDKLGLLPDKAPTERMTWGLNLQPAILTEFARRVAVDLEPERFIHHPGLPWFGGEEGLRTALSPSACGKSG
jgi:hypothetical protein